MTVKRIYSCNLCGKTLNEAKDNLVGIRWGANGLEKTHYFDIHNGATVEGHLCEKCIKNIKQMDICINGIKH